MDSKTGRSARQPSGTAVAFARGVRFEVHIHRSVAATRVCAIFCLVPLLAPAAASAKGDGELGARAARYEPMIVEAARRHGVDPRILWTIAYLETRFRPHLVSPANAAGLMQFIPGTARRFGLSDRFDPKASIDAAARYVRFLSRQFGGRLDLILAGYNAGEGAVAAFRDGRTIRLPNGRVINPRAIRTSGVPPYRETRGYVSSGRAVFDSLSRAGRFGAPPNPLPPAGAIEVAAESAEEIMARSTYFDFGRAVPLPAADEIASDVVLVTGRADGQRAGTRSIVFGNQ